LSFAKVEKIIAKHFIFSTFSVV